ncbi:MAG: diguanylate cyclase [Lachnospiraceae bacterium]|nr:diguanylate cyclase [Lachnospiraceae bacterium]
MTDWIIIVDDDIVNLKAAGRILSEHGMRVTALKSGWKLLDYIRENGMPDLVLLDIQMPDLDGFETLKELRKLGKEMNVPEVPVIFLTAAEDAGTENRGFDMGVSDFVHKPFDTEVLIKRIEHAIHTQETIKKYAEEATVDALTGLLNKQAANDQISALCHEKRGCLLIMDLDSFKLVNDIYGHEAGDRVLEACAKIFGARMRQEAVIGRIGGDEFMLFGIEMTREEDIRSYTEMINEELLIRAKEILGDTMQIPLGISVGAVFVPKSGTDFQELFRIADRALYEVKKNGKHSYRILGREIEDNPDIPEKPDLDTLTTILEERNISQNAMWMGREAFGNVYRYMIRYMERYHGTAYRMLITAEFLNNNRTTGERALIIDTLREQLQNSLRNSDIMMQIGMNQFFLLLPEIHEGDIEAVRARIIMAWSKTEYSREVMLSYETGVVHLTHNDEENRVMP